MLSSPLQLVYRFVNYQMDPIESGDILTTDAGPKHNPTLMMVNGVSVIPFLANICCCVAWVIYGLLTGLSAVLVGNGLGLMAALAGTATYLLVYTNQMNHVKIQFGTISPPPFGVSSGISNNPLLRAYQQALATQRLIQTQMAITAMVCVALVWYYFERGHMALPFIRLFCLVATIAMFAAPVTIIRKVMAGAALPSAVFTWPNIGLTLFNCILWLAFGLMISDVAVGVPNIVGIVVSLSQASLLMKDRRYIGLGR
eukprot:GILI01023312.1.p1 GENE.GILI01023312.1~~GILI01023312.1.p1  ORF type:complete len:296 (+),score=56.81 GILI01023312.1:122-889(+)